MKRAKAKLTAILMAVCCVFACLGVGVYVANSTALKATAAGTYTVTKIVADASSTATSVKISSAGGDTLPTTGISSLKKFTLTEGVVTINGKAIDATANGEYITNSGFRISSGLFTFNFKDGKEPSTYDVLSIDGTFVYTDGETSIIFEECYLQWNGTSWSEYIPVIKAEEVSNATNNAFYTATRGYLDIAGSWDEAKFVLATGTGSGAVLNDNALNNFRMRKVDVYWLENEGTVGLRWYIDIDTTGVVSAQAGDVLHIDGMFYLESDTTKVLDFDNVCLKYDGTTWVPIARLYDIGALDLHYQNANAGGNSAIYLQRADGGELPFKGWANPFVAESDNNFKVNGENAALSEMQSAAEGLYLRFSSLDAGDYITVSGAFVCENQYMQYVIEESKFQWNGSAWVEYVPPVDYTTYDVGSVYINSGGATGVYFHSVVFEEGVGLDLRNFPFVDGWTENIGWNKTFTFVEGSGAGITLNKSPINMGDIKVPGSMYVGLGTTAEAGDELVIEGTFYNEEYAVAYTVDYSQFVFNGSSWSVLYDTQEMGQVKIANGSSNTAVYFSAASGESFKTYAEGYGWNVKYSFVSGGITLNGNTLGTDDIKIPGDLYIGLGTTATEGDVLTISGTLRNQYYPGSYEIEESKFQWNGSAWEEYVPPVEYTTHKLGTFVISNESAQGGGDRRNNAIYLDRTSGDLPYPDSTWETKFVLESGGLKVNGNTHTLSEMKSTNIGLYIVFPAVETGDVVTISGVFVCDSEQAKYEIEESAFQWNGSAWINYVDYEDFNVGKVVIKSGDSQNAFYVTPVDSSVKFPKPSWNNSYYRVSGNGITIDNVEIANYSDIKTNNVDSLYLGVSGNIKVGSILKIGGTLRSEGAEQDLVFEESIFQWTGSTWIDYYEESQLAFYDTVSLVELDKGLEMNVSGTSGDNAGLTYVKSLQNTTGSVKFRFGYQSANTSSGNFEVRLRGTNWQGYHFIISGGIVQLVNGMSYPLASNTEYVIELAVIDIVGTDKVWIYISVDGAIVGAKTVTKAVVGSSDPFNDEVPDPAYSERYNTNHVSMYYSNVDATTITDPDKVVITYKHSAGEFSEYVQKNTAFNIAGARAGKSKTFVGWTYNGQLYAGDEEFSTDVSVAFEALEIGFTLEEGASIRLSETADTSGIKFTANLSQADVEKLAEYGTVKYGIIIMPYDYLGYNQAPNFSDFTTDTNAEKFLVKLPSSVGTNGLTSYQGAIQKLYESNYERLFAGRGYIEITIDDKTIYVYTPFNVDDNVRSIKYVAQEFANDTPEFDKVSENAQNVARAYAGCTVNLTNYSKYMANGLFSATAWYYPELDATNNYNNATNEAIATKMKEAGIKVVYLDGMYHLDLDTYANVVKTRQIIEFFWSQGLYTIAFGSNASSNQHIDYSSVEFPDFSSCEGFLGFLVWDEPQSGSFETLATFAQNFEKTYAGTGVTFMANLLPSYAAVFNGTSNWWESSIESLNKDDYKTYLKAYCDTVLSQVSGEKWLSMDSYPINADESLSPYFLFDLAMLKYYAEYAGATSHAVLQSSGWTEDGNTTKNRMPTEAEMRMQAYTAMAFGIDSISWWSYSDKREDNQYNPTDSEEYYTRFANVNNELANVSAIYKAFNWKGVILGAGTDNGRKIGSLVLSTDNDYEAFNAVSGQIGNYALSVSNTKNLTSISTNKTDWNYLMGVMEDLYGNEGYVLVNYNNHKDGGAQTITITFSTNVTEVIIYRGGVKQTVTVSNKTLTVDLATGEGVIILPQIG